ncbi:MAG: hypothetical protein NWR69_04680 [Flavobacteriales bacterium]|nr:hypothetical protein [Flavobacteriales bacterium]MDP4818288.1 hypothetical protein [Flavobacteriales bacterium]
MKGTLAYFFSGEGKWLRRVLLAAAVVRLIAAIFSEGYIMSDDHFLAVEPVSSWVHGENYHNWYPNAYNETDHAQPFSYTYYFLNFLILKFCALIGIVNPFIQAFILRLAHAALSLWGVYLFVKLAERLISSVTWRMFAIWFWVFGGVVTVFSVHQLVETACIPFVLLAYLYVLKYFEKDRVGAIIIAALAFSVSVGMRYQLVFFPLTLGLYLLWKRKWRGALLFGIFFTLGFALTQIDNLLFWHTPIYQHLLDYQSYNATHFADYPSNVFSYLALITYYVFPVVTGVFIYCLLRKKVAPQHSSSGHSSPTFVAPQHSDTRTIFMGVTVFIVFHLVFPNRQERFLLPVVPFVLLLMIRTISNRYPCEAPSAEPSEGTCNAPSARPWLHKAMRWSIYLSAIYTVSYSFYIPKSKYLEASHALYDRGDFQNVVIDNWKGEESVWLPMHYVGKFVHPFSMTNKKSLEQLKQQITHQPLYDSKRLPAPAPNYLIIWGKEESYPRAKAYEEVGFQLQRISPANSESELGFALYSLTLSSPL